MELEDALNLGLPPHHVSQCSKAERVAFRAEILGYPQCTVLSPALGDQSELFLAAREKRRFLQVL